MSTVKAAELKFFRGVVELAKIGEITIRRNDSDPNLFQETEVGNTPEGEDNGLADSDDISDFF
jgi:hypothetical protein